MQAPDRVGVRPLFLIEHGGRMHFASEVKAVSATHGTMPRSVDPVGTDEVFTF